MKASTDAKPLLGNLNPEGRLQVIQWCFSLLNGTTILNNFKIHTKDNFINIKAPQSLLWMDLNILVDVNNSLSGLYKNSDILIKLVHSSIKRLLLMPLETPLTTLQEEATFSWNLTQVPNSQLKLSSSCSKMSAQKHVPTLKHYAKDSNQRTEVKLLVTLELNSIELSKDCTFKVETLQRHTVPIMVVASLSTLENLPMSLSKSNTQNQVL